MKKEKEKVKFNPADYDYMDSMHLEGWIWEFIRRNRDYRWLYSEIKKEYPSKKYPKINKAFDFLLRDFGMEAVKHRPTMTPLPKEHFLIYQSPGVTDCFPNPYIKYNEFKQYKPVMLKGDIVRALIPPAIYKDTQMRINEPYKMPQHWINKDKQLSQKGLDLHHGDKNFNYICVHTMTRVLEVFEMEDTIYLGISRYAELPDVKTELDKIYKNYVTPVSSVREMRKEWQYYLKAYDLNEEKKYKPKDMAPHLYPKESNEYPDGYPVTKKISKQIQEAEKLINEKQYLKFLSLNISKEFRK